jgi:nitroimidazol reductase NimA-like FMN-containing flavoprotein (pyridoxamine 5'-phosphate oxidase superfamily)
LTKVPELSIRESSAILSSNLSLARLATSNRDGSPHVVPVWFIHRNGRVYVPSPARSLKARNVAERPAVSVVIDSYGGVLDAKGILMEGRAELLRGATSARLNLLAHEKYAGKSRVKRREWKEFMAEDDSTIAITPVKTRTWDFSRLKL